MIDEKELRIGNLLRHSGSNKPYMVTLERFWEHYTTADAFYYLDPIPLTPELLEKCGFIKTEYNSGNGEIGIYSTYLKKPLTYNTNHGWWFENTNIESTMMKPKNLHQLQNLYFALTGTELEIGGV